MLAVMRSELKSPFLQYFDGLQYVESPAVLRSRELAQEIGLSGISLGPMECRILAFFIRIARPLKFIEIGTLTGTTALTIAENVPENARVWSLEKNPQHALHAQTLCKHLPNLEILVGDARETLKTLEMHGPFDGIFIDGNKAAYKDYLDWAEKNVQKGGWILADNIFLSGAVFGHTESKFSQKQIEVMRAVNQRLSDPKLYQSAIFPTDEGLLVAQKLF